MGASKQPKLRRLGPLGLAMILASCGLPAAPPAEETVPAEIEQAPATQAPALYFAPYGSGLAQARWSHSADVIGDWLYVVGGADVDGQMTSVERARILPGGDLGEFRPAPTRLQVARDCHASLRIGDWLYVFGGDQRGSLDSVERARITNGELGGFRQVATRLSQARDEHTANRIGRYVYVVGGIQGPQQLDSVERAEVLEDGSLGPFRPYGRRLTAKRYGHWTEVHDGYLYVVGGLSENGDAGQVERARIQADGDLGPFERMASRLNERRDSPIAIGLNGWLYVIGGAQENAMHIKLRSVEAAPFTSRGLGSFVYAGGLRVGRDYHTVTRVGDWLYAIAGEKTYGGALASVERARVPAGGPASAGTDPAPSSGGLTWEGDEDESTDFGYDDDYGEGVGGYD